MNLISLGPGNFNIVWTTFTHPLMKGVETVDQDTLIEMADRVREDPTRYGGDFVLAMRNYVQYIISRYLAKSPTVHRFKSDLISEAITALLELMADLPDNDSSLLKIARRRVRDSIKLFLNDNQRVIAPSLRQQYYLKADGKDPVYLGDNVEVPEDAHPQESGDEASRDILDAFCKLVPSDEIDEALMDEFNWGRKVQELADELHVGVGTIHRRRAKLYRQFLELTQ